MKLLQLLLIILSVHNIVKTEYLLYKVDENRPDSISPLSYAEISNQKKERLKKFYIDTVFRYQFPTVQWFYNEFSEQEKNDYKAALKQPYGLFEFIKNKVEKQSKNRYSLTWVPTTVFELCALYIWAEAIEEESSSFGYSKKHISFKPSLSTAVQENREPRDADIDLYFITADYVLEEYQYRDLFINPTSNNNQFTKEFIRTIGRKIEQLNNYIGAKQSYDDISMYQIYENSFFPIIEKYLTHEQQAFEHNMFILSRGTNGYSSDKLQNLTAIDYKLGGEAGISYGYSLFAGTIFERFMPRPRGAGARAIDYIKRCEIGYVILINISDYTDNHTTFLKNIFALPLLTTTQGLFGYAEKFHPRLAIPAQPLTELQINDLTIKLSKYLAHAKIIKTSKTEAPRFVDILKQDIEFQTAEFINMTLQNNSSMESQEVLARNALHKEMSQTFIDDYKKGSIKFNNIPLEIIPFLNNEIIKSLSKEQVQSLTTAQLTAFTIEQILTLTEDELNPFTPDQIAAYPKLQRLIEKIALKKQRDLEQSERDNRAKINSELKRSYKNIAQDMNLSKNAIDQKLENVQPEDHDQEAQPIAKEA